MYNYKNEFFTHEIIQELGQKPRWTTGDGKKPLNIQHIFNIFETTPLEFSLYGARDHSEDNCCTLGNLYKTFETYCPNSQIQRFVFFLDMLDDDYIVLDIEPKCDPKLRDKLLKLPYIYGEVSMSGKGYHLIFPKPENYADFGDAHNKVKLQSKTTEYEILMYHWCTFTGNTIPLNENPEGRIEDIYEELAKEAQQKSFDKSQLIKLSKEMYLKDTSAIPNFDTAFNELKKFEYYKELEDFHNDNSRYEYAMGHYYGEKITKLRKIPQNSVKGQTGAEVNKIWAGKTKQSTVNNQDDYFSPDEQIIMLYKILTEKLKPRDKHAQFRNGMPLLLNMSQQIMSEKLNKKEDKQ